MSHISWQYSKVCHTSHDSTVKHVTHLLTVQWRISDPLTNYKATKICMCLPFSEVTYLTQKELKQRECVHAGQSINYWCCTCISRCCIHRLLEGLTIAVPFQTVAEIQFNTEPCQKQGTIFGSNEAVWQWNAHFASFNIPIWCALVSLPLIPLYPFL